MPTTPFINTLVRVDSMSELEFKLKSFKLDPQTPEQALENIRNMKKNLNLEYAQLDEKKLDDILKRAGSFTDEVLDIRRRERN